MALTFRSESVSYAQIESMPALFDIVRILGIPVPDGFRQ